MVICPYSKANNATLEGLFSTNLESVVECTFVILKKRWKVLNHGFKQCDIVKYEQIFIACCVLHNFLLDVITREQDADIQLITTDYGWTGIQLMFVNGRTWCPLARSAGGRMIRVDWNYR